MAPNNIEIQPKLAPVSVVRFEEDGLAALAATIKDYQGNAFYVVDSGFTHAWRKDWARAMGHAVSGRNAYALKPTEQAKSLKTVQEIIAAMAERMLNRDTLVVGVGGGITCDVAALASALYMRGTPLLLVPTTLVAMADAAIGGKTAVNFHAAKNLAGTFHLPSATIIDVRFLSTLPPERVSEGWIEILKTAILFSPDRFNALYQKRHDVLAAGGADVREWVEFAVREKARVVDLDYLDADVRHALNLGHTFAHAIESVAMKRRDVPKLSHGAAVGIGLVLAHRLTEAQKVLEEPFEDELRDILAGLHVPLEDFEPYKKHADDAWLAVAVDKKATAAGSVFIVPRRVGDCTPVAGVEKATFVKVWTEMS
jgi:3-dehydroquinate synthetase